MKMEDCTVEENVQIAKDTYKMKIKGNFVKECRTPGQFVNIRIGDGREYMLRRPISISEIDRGENLVTIIYRIVGEGTKFMANIKKGNEIDIMGPLGRGYDVLSLTKEQTALLVGGGIGVPPLYELAKQFNKRGVKTITILGFNTKDEVFYEEEFKKYNEWLIDLEWNKFGLPSPDLVIFLDMPYEYSNKLIKLRLNKITGQEQKDILEADENQIIRAYNTAKKVVAMYDAKVINCIENNEIRNIKDIQEEMLSLAKEIL